MSYRLIPFSADSKWVFCLRGSCEQLRQGAVQNQPWTRTAQTTSPNCQAPLKFWSHPFIILSDALHSVTNIHFSNTLTIAVFRQTSLIPCECGMLKTVLGTVCKTVLDLTCIPSPLSYSSHVYLVNILLQELTTGHMDVFECFFSHLHQNLVSKSEETQSHLWNSLLSTTELLVFKQERSPCSEWPCCSTFSFSWVFIRLISHTDPPSRLYPLFKVWILTYQGNWRADRDTATS